MQLALMGSKAVVHRVGLPPTHGVILRVQELFANHYLGSATVSSKAAPSSWQKAKAMLHLIKSEYDTAPAKDAESMSSHHRSSLFAHAVGLATGLCGAGVIKVSKTMVIVPREFLRDTLQNCLAAVMKESLSTTRVSVLL